MNNIKIYCVIVTYNGEKWIHPCLSSLVNSTLAPHIFVIDNGSTDNTIEIIKTQYPQVELVISDKNLGFGQGNNQGILAAIKADADYVYLLNQDAWVENDTFEKLVDIHVKNPEYGILSTMHVNAAHTQLDYNFSSYVIPRFCPDLYSDIYFKTTKDVYECNFVNAAAWLISKECINKVGLFDPVFFHYGEDRNYCQRTLYHNLKIGICPDLTIVHDRERKGVTKQFQGVKEKIRDYLVKLADINNKNFKADRKKLLAKHLFKMTKDAVTFNKKSYANERELYNLLTARWPEILESRKRNKQFYKS